MSHEDDVVAHLKSLERPAPTVRVDRRRVLSAGRRRRGARAAAVTAAGVVAVAGVVTAAMAVAPGTHHAAVPATSSTSTPTTSPVPAPSPSPAHAVIDPVTGLVTTPFSTFMVNQHDLDIMMSAWDLARSRCMAEAGYADRFVFAVTHTAVPDMSTPYGIWDRDALHQRGYAGPTLDPYAGEGSEIHVSSPAVETAMETCADQVRPMGFIFEPTSFDDLRPAVGVETAGDTAEGKGVVAEWVACLATHGVAGPEDDDSLMPAGVLSMSLADQVRIGLVDIDCKESTDLRQRLADIDAANQQAYLDAAPAFEAAYRETVETALAASRAYLSASGIDMP